MTEYYLKQTELIEAKVPFVSVTLVDSIGSTPQDQGSKILVTNDGLYYGTIGGGKVETKSIKEAIELLNGNKPQYMYVQWNLNKDVGMTCGGTVRLFFEVFNFHRWNITVFGAGHVSNTLIPLLLNLDCSITCIDPREEWLSKLPESPKLTKIQSDDMPSQVKNIKENSFVLLMTMGHTTDKPILLEIFRSGRKFPYLGVIGSRAKANILKRDITEAGLPDEYKSMYYCPMGLDLGNNSLFEISISIISQLIQERDRIF